MILLFLGMFIVLFTCFSARKEKKKSSSGGSGRYGDKTGADNGVGNDGYATTQPTRRTRRNRWF